MNLAIRQAVAPDASVFPVSFAQERIWFIDQLEPHSSTYNVPTALHLSGVNEDALREAIQRLAERHEAFRTTFAVVDGVPMQVIAAEPSVRVRQIDITHLAPGEREAAASALRDEEAARPFDLSSDHLLRTTLIKLGKNEHLFLLTTHHIVSDLWSLMILVRDFSALYEASRRFAPPDLPQLPIQYADFTQWQRNHLQGETLNRLLAYWTSRLRGAPPEVTFPIDHPRPATQSSRGDTVPFAIPCSVTRALGELSRKEHASLFMTLLAAFQALLGRYAGLDDVIVGAPIANRMRAETANVIGFFANTLALRTDLSGDPPFRALLQRVRDATLQAYDYQDLPFEKLVAALNPERNPSLPPLFQVLFALQTTTVEGVANESEDQGQHSVWKETLNGTAKFDLAFLLRQTSAGIEGGLQYCSDLYESSTIKRIARHFAQLIEAIASNPDARLSELLRLPDADRRELEEWGAGKATDVQPKSVLELFDSRVKESPDAIAVRSGDETVSYAQLSGWADRIAGLLRSRGVGPDSRVGLSVVRCPAQVAALLGVLKAGGAYVPLDPDYPAERLAFIARDAALHALVSDGSLTLDDLGDRTLRLDDVDGAAWAQPALPAVAEQLAYVIYTSGSTGEPKGVAMPHGPLANLIAWQLATSRVAKGHRTVQLTPLSFDVSFQEIFATLCSGGELVLADQRCRTDMNVLLRHLRNARIDRLFAPPVLLNLLAEAAEDEPVLPDLKEIITAGEQLRVTPALRSFVERMPNCVLRNQYGPSESHVVTEECVELAEAVPPIGRPIWNTRIRLLDAALRPVPIGAVGELHIAAAPLARCYLDRPQLSAERFLPDPDGDKPGCRMYRTGDLARFGHDGRLWFLGRADEQLKIRGFRLEPGEVEAEIARHPGVRNVAVVGFEQVPGHRQLVAYLELDAGASLDPARLRESLRDRLPAYAVPSIVTALERLPTTPSGKLDRVALARQQPSAGWTGSVGTLPRTSLERELAGIWSEVLGVTAISVDDVFFDIGGHSLATAQVAARVKRQMGVALPLRAMFDAPTIAGLAVDIVARRAVELEPRELDVLLLELRHLELEPNGEAKQ